MTGCSEPRYREMLHQYELDLLPEVDLVEFEQHLLECDECYRAVTEFQSVARHLAHSPDVRKCVEDILAETSDGTDVESSARSGAEERRSWRSFVPISLAAVAVLVFLVLKPWEIEIHSTMEAVATEGRLIVMPFENLVDPEDSLRLGSTISHLLTTDLSQSKYMNVVPAQQLRKLVDFVKRDYEDSGDEIDPSVLVARRSRAQWVITGAIVQTEPVLVLSARLSDVISGETLASRRAVGRTGDDMFMVVDSLTVEVKNLLSLPLEALTEMDRPVADVTTASYDAYRSYLEGVEAYLQIRYNDARREFQQALKYDSTYAMAYYFLASLGQPELIAKAIEYSDQAAERDRLHIMVSKAAIDGDDDRRIALLREILQKHPRDIVALLQLANHEANAGHTDVAEQMLLRAIDEDPLYRFAFNTLAYLYARTGQLEEALCIADRYISIAPGEANPYDTKADILLAMRDLPSAITALEQVVVIDPGFAHYQSQLKLGRLYVFHGHFDKANARFQEIAAQADRGMRSQARTGMALIPMYQGKFDSALSILDDGIVADRMELATSGNRGDRSVKHFVKSLIYLEQGSFDQSVLEHQQAIAVHSDVVERSGPLFRCTYAQVLADAGRYGEADQIADVLRQEAESGQVSSWAAHHYATGCIELAKGHSAAAADHLRKACEQAGYVDFRHMKAKAQLAAGMYEEAIAEFEWLADNPAPYWSLVLGIWTVKAHYYLGRAYEATDRIDDAIAQYETLLDTWKDSDEDLAAVEDARQRLVQLKKQS